MVEFSVTSTCMVYKTCYLRTLDSKSIALTLGLPRGIFNTSFTGAFNPGNDGASVFSVAYSKHLVHKISDSKTFTF